MRKNKALETNQAKFERIARENIKREGLEDLLVWLADETDFYTSPASTRYHGSYVGGLVEHSLNVYHNLVRLVNNFSRNFDATPATDWDDETLAIIALFHDLCKVNSYEAFDRNVKDEDTGEWYKEASYRHNQGAFEMGHGPKSVFYVQQFMQLSDLEAQAIFWHMGAFDISLYASMNGLGSAYNSNEYAFLLHLADYSVTYIVENKSDIYIPLVGKLSGEEQGLELKTEAKKRTKTSKTGPIEPEEIEAEVTEVTEEEEEAEVEAKPRKRRRAATKATSDDTEEPAASDDTEEPAKQSRRRTRGRAAKANEAAESSDGANTSTDSEETDEGSNPASRRRRRGNSGAASEPDNDANEETTKQTANKIRRPGKASAKAADEEEEAPAEKTATKRRARRGKVEPVAVEPEEPEVEEIDEEDYEGDILEEDFYWKRTDNGAVGVWKAGELLPEEYDEDLHEPIDKEEYEDAVKPTATQKARPRSRRRK